MQTEAIVAAAAFVAMFGMWVVLPGALRRRAASKGDGHDHQD